MAGNERNRRSINAAQEVRGLLVPDVPDKTADLHDFVKVAHRPRVFRCWMSELGDICRDYFWYVHFCLAGLELMGFGGHY